MELQVTVHLHDHRQGSRLGDLEMAIASLIETIHSLKDSVMSALSDLQKEVTETGTVVDSAITLLRGLKEALDAAIASGDPAALAALSAELDTKTNALAAAISANTPAA